MRIRLPLTLAIIPSLIVNVAEQRYAIPQVNLVELVRVKPADVPRPRSRKCAARRSCDLRGRTCFRWWRSATRCSGLGEEPSDTAEAESSDPVLIVVLRVGRGARSGWSSTHVSDSEEIVVKPLSRMLEDCGVYAGAAIMGDGHPAMILDAGGLAHPRRRWISRQEQPRRRAKIAQDDAKLRRSVSSSSSPMRQRASASPSTCSSLVRLEKIHAVRRSSRSDARSASSTAGRGLPARRASNPSLPVRPTRVGRRPALRPDPEDGPGRRAGSSPAEDHRHRWRPAVELETTAGDDPRAIAGRSVIQGKLTVVLDTRRPARRPWRPHERGLTIPVDETIAHGLASFERLRRPLRRAGARRARDQLADRDDAGAALAALRSRHREPARPARHGRWTWAPDSRSGAGRLGEETRLVVLKTNEELDGDSRAARSSRPPTTPSACPRRRDQKTS